MAFIIGTTWDGYVFTVGPLGVEPFLGWLHLLSGLVFSFLFYSWTVRRWTFLGLAASFIRSRFFFSFLQLGPSGVGPFLGWLHLLSGLIFSLPFYSWTRQALNLSWAGCIFY
jgi:hypothetical protein